MAYTPTTWVEGVTTLGPTHMNNIEDGISKAPYGPDASANNVPIWSGSAWTYGLISQSNVAAGNKITAQAMASGPPSSPSTGDIWVATAVDGNGTTWMFRYNSSETSFKWEFIGGAPISAGPAGSATTTTTGWTDLTTSPPTATLARAGDYIIDWGVQGTCSAFTTAYFGQARIFAGAGSSSTPAFGCPIVFSQSTVVQRERVSGLATSSVVKIQVQNDRAGGGTTGWSLGWFNVIPVRVS